MIESATTSRVNHRISCQSVAFTPDFTHSSGRIARGVGSNRPAVQLSVIDPRSVQSDVERVLHRFCRIEYFGLGSIAGKVTGDTRSSSGETTVATDRDAQLWKSTIARKLGHLPGTHRKALQRAAEIKIAIAELAREERDLGYLLVAPRAQYSIRKARGKVEDLKTITGAMAAVLQRDRERLVRGAVYREAILMLWHVMNETDEIREYCLEPVTQ